MSSVRSGAIGNSQSSTLATTVILSGDANLSFDVKTSTEYYWDSLSFSVDGSRVATFSGSRSWATYSTTLSAGMVTLEWTYSKDSSGSGGSDVVHIDNLQISTSSVGTLNLCEPAGMMVTPPPPPPAS